MTESSERNARPRQTPYYDLVPKDFIANCKFRREMIQLGCSDEKAAEELWIMCRRDLLFYVNTFVFTYDPRLPEPVIPFITYDYQDEALVETEIAIVRGQDLLFEKSRDMGATWIGDTVIEKRWHFHTLQSFLMLSRVEDLVDKTEDPDCLFWKIDFLIQNLPPFLKPNVNRNKLHIYNKDNSSTIDGVSTTGNAGRGGRRTAIFLDEFASIDMGHEVLSSTRDVTRCRLFNSTPKGTGNAFFDMTQTPIKKLRFHWSLHPVKRMGLYTSENGTLKILDDGYKFEDDYPFILDGKLRSPWYDNECKRAAHPMEIAQELDIDYLGSDYQFFTSDVIKRIQTQDIRPPLKVGELEFEPDSLRPLYFTEQEGGNLHVWISIDPRGRISETIPCVLGVDIAAGTGSSNSAISVVNEKTGEKILEYASAFIKPERLARLAVALARWCNNGFLIWDGAGHGRVFSDTVIELGYRNIYYRRNDKSITKKVTDIPGYFLTADNKLSLLGAYRKALDCGAFTQRSYEANRECLQYVFTTKSTVEHAGSRNTVDPTGAKDNHGDRVIADALAWRAVQVHSYIESEIDMTNDYCYAARRQRYLERQRNKNYW